MNDIAHQNPRLASLLGISDLTKEPHAVSLMKDEVINSLPTHPKIVIDGPRIVPAEENYTLLGYHEDSVMHEKTYTHWVSRTDILRTQTTSVILGDLRRRAPELTECTLIAPGIVYRRDVRDRWHCAQPHQMDIWVLAKHPVSLSLKTLLEKILGGVIPGIPIQYRNTNHPYTKNGVEVSAQWNNQWLEIGEGGDIDPALLDRLGICSKTWGGLALGLGLDRLVMTRKNLPDIRLLRDPLPSIACQMSNLSEWIPISRQPSASREISLARSSGESEEALTEALMDCLEEDEERLVQSVDVLARTPEKDLPANARARLGIQKNQDNMLIKVTWQSESQSIPRQQVNSLMAKIYRGLHQGESYDYCP